MLLEVSVLLLGISGAPRAAALPAASVLPILDDAERLARNGDITAAAVKYDAVLAEPLTPSMRLVVRYDRARALALFDNDGPSLAALNELARLSETRSTIAINAALARCQALRRRDPAVASLCLDEIIKGGGPGADDARRLQERWRS